MPVAGMTQHACMVDDHNLFEIRISDNYGQGFTAAQVDVEVRHQCFPGTAGRSNAKTYDPKLSDICGRLQVIPEEKGIDVDLMFRCLREAVKHVKADAVGCEESIPDRARSIYSLVTERARPSFTSAFHPHT